MAYLETSIASRGKRIRLAADEHTVNSKVYILTGEGEVGVLPRLQEMKADSSLRPDIVDR